MVHYICDGLDGPVPESLGQLGPLTDEALGLGKTGHFKIPANEELSSHDCGRNADESYEGYVGIKGDYMREECRCIGKNCFNFTGGISFEFLLNFFSTVVVMVG